MDRYWVNDGIANDWFDADNWSLVSNGAGGAGVPTAVDDVYFDGNGHAFCWPGSDIECNNFSMLTNAEMFLISASAIIHGNFLIEDGYFGPNGGPDYTIEFKGNWLNTGGIFAVGTGSGKDPECIFSGLDKTYDLTNVTGATFQNVFIVGSLTMTGTRLSIMTIAQKLSVTGLMTINRYDATTISQVDLNGYYAGFDVFTGGIAGTGKLLYRYRPHHIMVTTGTIVVRYFRYMLRDTDDIVTIPARKYEEYCSCEIEFEADNQKVIFGAGKHHFGELVILGDNAVISTAEIDWDTNFAQVWCEKKFDINQNAFPNTTVTLKLGDNTHVFRGTVDFYFSYSSATTQLNVDAGEGTLIFWPKGRTLVPL